MEYGSDKGRDLNTTPHSLLHIGVHHFPLDIHTLNFTTINAQL